MFLRVRTFSPFFQLQQHVLSSTCPIATLQRMFGFIYSYLTFIVHNYGACSCVFLFISSSGLCWWSQHECSGWFVSSRWLWRRCVSPQPPQDILHPSRRRGSGDGAHWSVCLSTCVYMRMRTCTLDMYSNACVFVGVCLSAFLPHCSSLIWRVHVCGPGDSDVVHMTKKHDCLTVWWNVCAIQQTKSFCCLALARVLF